jgi:hypothetical protein
LYVQTVLIAVFGIQHFDVMCTSGGCESVIILAGFDVLTAVVMMSSISWDILPCSPLKVSGCFGRTCLLATLHHSGFLLALYLDPEDGSYMFLQNISLLSVDYMALWLRR